MERTAYATAGGSTVESSRDGARRKLGVNTGPRPCLIENMKFRDGLKSERIVIVFGLASGSFQQDLDSVDYWGGLCGRILRHV